MTKRFIFAGYGGQGMLLCGQMLAQAAMYDGYFVTWLPTYGPEMRGGAAACAVVISDSVVGSPLIMPSDVVTVASRPSFDKYKDFVKEGGSLIFNSSLILLDESEIKPCYVALDAQKLAAEAGNEKSLNMVILGAANRFANISEKSINEAIAHKFKKPALCELNEKAVLLGSRA
ncbi:MAG: 2-oxoacid:acceptor oxidoreductase family protein [Clostridiales bacterium]|nr:2-oxoacid:acceptor oxidoreductase family protein [Clostridiales bacterium]